MDLTYALDLETASEDPSQPYALEAFRLAQGKARITSAAVFGSDGYNRQVHEREGDMYEGIMALLSKLEAQEVWAHNAVFDVAWLISLCGLDIVSRIKWRDTSLLAKWIHNGQVADKTRISYALVSLIERHVHDHPDRDEFLDMKRADVKPGENYDYWLRRGRMDAELTCVLARKLWPLLPSDQHRAFLYEQGNIVPVARAWLMGLQVDRQGAKDLGTSITKAKAVLSKRAGISGSVITSSTQLADYLHNKLKLPVVGRTPKGKPSVSKDNLNILADRLKSTDYGPMFKAILDYKKLATTESKFVKGILTSCEYTGSDRTFASPNIFGTYTGRYTYSSKTLKKFPVGIANHQIPRQGPVRKLLTAPEGYTVLELDASQQELRFIGEISDDVNLITEFNAGMDVHSSMSAYISGHPYDEFQELYHGGDREAVNYRYAGKLLNLSCQYRIGAKALAFKFFTTYGINISQGDAYRYLGFYKSRYRGVVDYWEKAIRAAKKAGYAQSIGNRRYKIKFWSGKAEFGSEQSAINFPIQGSGGDHKNLAISLLFRKFPQAIFILDLHDGLFFYIPTEGAKELALEMRDYLNTTDWGSYWNRDIKIPFPFDAKIGPSFGKLTEL